MVLALRLYIDNDSHHFATHKRPVMLGHEHQSMELGLKKTGLTLGKFAPLHKGHQYLIETALAEMDEVVVMIYATEVTDIPLNVRAA